MAARESIDPEIAAAEREARGSVAAAFSASTNVLLTVVMLMFKAERLGVGEIDGVFVGVGVELEDGDESKVGVVVGVTEGVGELEPERRLLGVANAETADVALAAAEPDACEVL